MSANHNHSSHDHSHAPKDFTRAFAIGVSLNLGFVIIEAAYGFWANSLALVADAGHNLSDVLGLILAWVAAWLSKRKPSATYSYGLRSSSILASLSNAIFLLVATGGIAWEAIIRFRNPEFVESSTVIWVAAIGIAINASTALLFAKGREKDLNIRAAYLHMAADALVSLAVVVTGIGLAFTGWLWLDPAMSLLVSIVIVFGTWGILKESLSLVLQAVPKGIDPEKVRNFLRSQKNVLSTHDLHIWAMSTTETALTAHLVYQGSHPGDQEIRNISHTLEHDFNIHHTTLQIEIGDTDIPCPLENEDSL